MRCGVRRRTSKTSTSEAGTASTAGRPDSPSRTILARAEVVAIGRGEQRAAASGALAGGVPSPAPGGSARVPQSIATVTLAVPADQVESVTAAKYAGELDLVWLGSDGAASVPVRPTPAIPRPVGP